MKVPSNYSYNRFVTQHSEKDNAGIGPCHICGGKGKYLNDVIDVIHGSVEIRTIEELEGTWDVEFFRCVIHSQTHGSNNEHASATLYFEIWSSKDGRLVDGKDTSKTFQCAIRQPHGESFSFDDVPLEVEMPNELKGQLSYQEFRDAAEDYYKTLIGAKGVHIRIEPGAKNTRIIGDYEVPGNRSCFYVIPSSNFQGAW